ncbi:type I restriction enzyme HsdR N-terminal domain-containing protein [Ascidiimonas aurantiaca]|uniref:type I restriction enzyme HsdR N-terminal domain-containing protein n=1 Tax=Ascidiimonas aurantiaca TaxID=1685432 RepID=UPI0030EF339D
MRKLNFPEYHFRFKNSENTPRIFDPVRKKFVILQPEEWVRQHVVQFLHRDKKYPLSLINVEKELTIHGLRKRYDVVVYRPDGSICIVVECKAPEVQIRQEVFDQIARYNLSLGARYLMVTNGLRHFYCTADYENEKFIFLRDIPSYIT